MKQKNRMQENSSFRCYFFDRNSFREHELTHKHILCVLDGSTFLLNVQVDDE